MGLEKTVLISLLALSTVVNLNSRALQQDPAAITELTSNESGEQDINLSRELVRAIDENFAKIQTYAQGIPTPYGNFRFRREILTAGAAKLKYNFAEGCTRDVLTLEKATQVSFEIRRYEKRTDAVLTYRYDIGSIESVAIYLAPLLSKTPKYGHDFSDTPPAEQRTINLKPIAEMNPETQKLSNDRYITSAKRFVEAIRIAAEHPLK